NARRAAPLGRSPRDRHGLRERERLENLENLSKTIERDGLRQEVEGPEPQAFLCVPLRRDSRDHHDRDAGVAHRTELEEVEAAHAREPEIEQDQIRALEDRKSTRLNSSHVSISY